MTDNKLSLDAIYKEAYGEMRRYRDYEFVSATWYFALLFAIINVLAADSVYIYRYGFLISIFFVILVAGLFSVCFAHGRYMVIRKNVQFLEKEDLESYYREKSISNKEFESKCYRKKLKPYMLIIIAMCAFLVFSLIVLYETCCFW